MENSSSSSAIDEQMDGWETTQMQQINPRKTERIEWALEIVKQELLPEDTILDVGCGQGYIHAYLGQPSKYLGIDISPQEVQIARTNCPGVDFECMSLFHMRGYFDVVLCSRVLMHIAPFDKALRKLYDLSRRRLFIITELADKDEVEWQTPKGMGWWYRKIDRSHFANDERVKILKELGKYSLIIIDRS